MGWDDSNKDNNKKDPWSGKNQGPPDLDEAFKNLQRKIRKVMGGGSSGGTGSTSSSADGGSSGMLFGLLGFIAVLFWALSGIFIVGPAEQAAILRFGKYVETVGPGPHWIPRFIETKYVRNVDKRSKYTYSSQMLTKDENIVQVSISVIYRIGNLENYLFNVTDPVESLQQATASSLRQVVGHTSLDEIITKGRETWGQNVDVLLSSILKDYKTGIVVASVSPQPARAPEKVQDAFDDAITAQEDEKRFMEKARSYQEKVIPRAKGKAQRLLSEAQADAAEWVLRAEGNVAEFLALLPQYKHSPNIMRERMYIDSIEKVLSQSSKILVDSKAGNMMLMPLDRLLSSGLAKKSSIPVLSGDDTNSNESSLTNPSNGRTDSGALRSNKKYNRFGSRF